MPPISIPHVAIPSPALLRFLRFQTEQPSALSTFVSRHARNTSKLQQTRYASTRHAKDEVKLLPSPRQFRRPQDWERGYSPQPSSAFTSNTPTTRHRRHSSSSEAKPYLRRLFSSNRANSLWDFLGLGNRAPISRTSDLPPLASFLDDNQPGRILKPTNEPRLRCTEFDENGNVTLMNGEFKKSELIAKYGLLTRDLRKIDSALLPHILIRPTAILLNLLHLRVLIKHNRVLVFDTYGSTNTYTQSIFMYDLEGKLRQMDAKANGSLPYEFRALEAVLISVTTGLEGEFEGVRDPVLGVLRELEEDIDRDKLRYLLIYSKKLGTFEQKARLVRDALDELLEADDDLAAMYLTEKAAGHGRSENEHTEVEMLLESYHKVTDEIVQASENLVSSIRNTEEM
jgi:magnesium transporter